MDPLTAGLAISAGTKLIGELTPAAFAQRREFKKARDRLAKGEYGFSQAQKQQDTTAMNQAVAQQAAGQQADIARQQAGGLVSGGGAAAAQREIAKAQAAQTAQNQAAVQAQSNQAAKAQYAADQGMVAQQAARSQQLLQGLASDAMQYGVTRAKYGADADANLANNLANVPPDQREEYLKMIKSLHGQGRVDYSTDNAG